ncbi:MAG: hypothetical protein A2Z20_06920 [Bdellovibrionales bacterium RBG_16_40_8]|nr:MAG: hypothetical protein A2Z20_06920 [Bdellovibrionales bacterium RBG_16_40_8]
MSNLAKRAISLILILCIGLQAFASTGDILQTRIDSFIKIYQEKEFAYGLSLEELEQSAQEAGLENIFANMVYKVNREKTRGLVEPNAQIRFDRHDEIVAMQNEALFLVRDLFAQNSIEEMNLTLISLFRDYIFHPEMRGPLSIILKQIENYKFSEFELREIQKKKDKLYQFTNGVTWGGLAVGALALFASRRHIAALLERISTKINSNALAKRAGKNARTPKILHAAAEPKGAMTLEQYFKKSGGSVMGYTIKDFQSPVQVTKIATNFSKFNIYKKILNLGGKESMIQLAQYSGIVATFGVGNIGLQAYLDAVYGSTGKNTLLNPKNLLDDFYSGLTVLNLSCRSRAMVFRSQKAVTAQERFAILKEMNAIYSEYELLKDLLPNMMTKINLPAQITYDAKTGKISFDLLHLNLKDKGEFNCAKKMQGAKKTAEPLEASLPEVLYDVTLTYFNLASAENQ